MAPGRFMMWRRGPVLTFANYLSYCLFLLSTDCSVSLCLCALLLSLDGPGLQSDQVPVSAQRRGGVSTPRTKHIHSDCLSTASVHLNPLFFFSSSSVSPPVALPVSLLLFPQTWLTESEHGSVMSHNNAWYWLWRVQSCISTLHTQGNNQWLLLTNYWP